MPPPDAETGPPEAETEGRSSPLDADTADEEGVSFAPLVQKKWYKLMVSLASLPPVPPLRYIATNWALVSRRLLDATADVVSLASLAPVPEIARKWYKLSEPWRCIRRWCLFTSLALKKYLCELALARLWHFFSKKKCEPCR